SIRAFLPGLRAQREGTIVNLSSIGALHGYPSNGVYCATKFALEGITQALEAEIEPFGLHAVIIEPGYFRTSFLSGTAAGGAANLAPPLAAYEGTVAHKARGDFDAFNGRQLGNPVEGAAGMWEYVAGEGLFKGKQRRLRLPLGSDTGKQMKALSDELAETARDYEEIWSSTDFKE
ncbi:hypothetical protein C8A03DRAFT_14568, partial [Achaetomium macrosporum]